MIIAPILGHSYVWYSRKTMEIPVILHMNGLKVETTALIDSGAAGIFINHEFVLEHGLRTRPLPKDIGVFNVDGTQNLNGSITRKVTADLFVKSRRMKDIQFLETALGKQSVILGYPWLVNANPKINWRKREFSWWEEDDQFQVNIFAVLMEIQHEIEEDLYEETEELVIQFIRNVDKPKHEIDDEWIEQHLDPLTIRTVHKETPPVSDQWIQDKMSKSQLFAYKSGVQTEKASKSVEELILKEFHKFIPTVFSERPVGTLPTRKTYDHAIDLKPEYKPVLQ